MSSTTTNEGNSSEIVTSKVATIYKTCKLNQKYCILAFLRDSPDSHKTHTFFLQKEVSFFIQIFVNFFFENETQC